MKLEFIDDISEGGRYEGVVSERLIRLFDFDEAESGQLLQRLHMFLDSDEEELDLSALPFMQSLNCRLILRVAAVDKGVLERTTPFVFICELTRDSYRQMTSLIEGVKEGYNWLCDTSGQDIDFYTHPVVPGNDHPPAYNRKIAGRL